MEEEKLIVERNGTVYEMKKKKMNYDARLNIKVCKKTIDNFKEIAQNEGIKYQTLIRKILEDFVEKYK